MNDSTILDALDDSIKITSSNPDVGFDACVGTNSPPSATSITVHDLQEVTVPKNKNEVPKVYLISGIVVCEEMEELI